MECLKFFPWLRGVRIKSFVPSRIFLRFLFLFLAPILGWGILLSFGSVAEGQDNLRVLILRDVPAVKIAGEGLALHDLKTGQRLFKNKRSSLIVEREAGPRLRVRGQSISGQGFWVDSSGGPLVINGRQYRDKLKILPGPNRDVWVVNVLPLEEYLVGLINYEISSQWTMEAIKTQVVAARTYAFFQRANRTGELYDVDSGISDQVYGGVGKEDDRSRKAVRETRGELLLYRGNAIFAVYSACCGGKTESAEDMWAGNHPYLRSVECNYCLDSPHFLWNYSIDEGRLAMALDGTAPSGFRVLGLEIDERSSSRRVLRLTVQTEKNRRQISGKDFRRLLGYDLFRSTNFVMNEKERVFHFSGLGWGHGVGLCQWGAKGMAEAGADYRAILKYYYQDVEIGKVPW